MPIWLHLDTDTWIKIGYVLAIGSGLWLIFSGRPGEERRKEG